MADTPTKRYANETNVCRTCNCNIILKNHPLDLFGDKATEERIVVDLEKFCRVKIIYDDSLPTRICRSCHSKIKKFQEFVEMVFHSKKQQESLVRFKRGKKIEESPTSSTSPARRSKKKGKADGDEATSKVRVSLFTTQEQCQEATQFRRILPAPTEQVVTDSTSGISDKQRKLPSGIAPLQKKQSKSVEILSNSGRRNPLLVNV